ncbi:MAG: coenzyme pyrophosphatase [Proteobacteria bacterium]|nr:coenzyme pyrophosphatase [Pseudomonadota bacterium]
MQRDAQLRRRIVEHLQGFSVHRADAAGHRAAAVAVAIADEGHGADLAGIRDPQGWSTAAALLLTRRAGSLRAHAGQWALPGGRIDEGETPEQAALRELHEEVGLQLGSDSLIGRLDDFVTRSGYVITPVLVWAGAARDMVPNPHEVQSIHRIPVSEFLRADAPMLETRDDSEHPVLRMPVGDSWIAAPTAAVLYQFRELCIWGRPTRVAHFEQPHFAWK